MNASIDESSAEPGIPVADLSRKPYAEITTILPQEKGVLSGLAEIWRYRSLFYWLVWRDFKVRYKHTAVGLLWALLQPIAQVVVLTFALGYVVRVPTGSLPYAVFILSGLTIWTLFTTIVQTMSIVLVSNSALVSKIYFPRVVLVLSGAGIPVMDFLVMLVLVIAVSGALGVPLAGPLLLVIPVALLGLLLAIGTGLWMAFLNTRYRDTRFLVPVILQVGLFVSPVLYPLDLVPEGLHAYLAANPMVVVIEGFRYALFGEGIVSGPMLAVSAAVALALVGSGLIAFQRTERSLVDAL